MSKSLGAHKVEIHGGTNFNTTELGHVVLCSRIYATLLLWELYITSQGRMINS